MYTDKGKVLFDTLISESAPFQTSFTSNMTFIG